MSAARRQDGKTARRLLLVAGLLAVLPPCRLPAQAFPDRPPAATPLRPVRFPPFVNGRLPNGLSTLVVQKSAQPVVTITLALPAGSFHDPEGKTGLAEMVATVLTKGTARRTAEQIAAEIEGAGGGIGASADEDFLYVTVSGLSAGVEQLFDILGDVVQNASFPAGEVDLAKTQMLSSLQAALAQPEVLASRAFGQEVYGTHPYGRVQTAATVGTLTRDDVSAFYSARVKPTGALLVVAGDVTPARVTELATRSLGGWSGRAAPAAAAPPIPQRARSEIVLVHKPGAVQSNIAAGFPFITPRDPNFYALTVMNRLLGGGADSRLFLILREQKGWTYGAYSGFSRPLGVGRFEATTEVRTEVTDSALTELVRQLNRLRTELPPDSEVASAKNYLMGRFPLTIETADDIATRVASARLLGLPDDYVIRYRERLGAVTRAQIQAAARRFLTTDRMAIVVVGDGPRILAGLKATGLPVRIVNTEGAAMTEADLAPRASAVRLDGTRLSAGTTRYRIMLQGTNAVGDETRTVARVTEGGRDAWQVITITNIAVAGLQQSDTTTVDAATLAPIRVRQGGRQQGQETLVRLDYQGGRVRGQARVMDRTGPRDITVDTALAAGVVDDNAIAAVIVSLPLAAGGRWTLPVFSGGKNAVLDITATVSGEENITVPAGTFASWKVEVTGGQVPVTMYVAKENPVIVKLELQGIPLAFELTERR